MRMRRKRNLDERLLRCKDYLIEVSLSNLNAKEAVKQSQYLDFVKIFGNDNKVEMEIGCGKGKFICEKAIKNPDINFIGIEKITNVVISGYGAS